MKKNLKQQMNRKTNRINIELTDDIAQGTYANLAMIAHSSSEFVIDFISSSPSNAGVPLASSTFPEEP